MLPTIQNPSLTLFKPRSVMLSNQAMNNSNNKPSKTLNPCQKKTLLHCSILHYLERSGFSKTLKYFRREAQIENAGGNDCLLDLEEMYYKRLETSDNASTNQNNYKEQDLQPNGNKDGAHNCVALFGTVSKKKKKRSGESNINGAVNDPGTANKTLSAKDSEETLTKDIVLQLNVKSKEKTSKMISVPLDQETQQVGLEVSKEPVDDIMGEPQLHESGKKVKDKKKKENKLVPQPPVDNAELHQVDKQPVDNEEKPKGLASSEDKCTTAVESNNKSKDKKKKTLHKEKSKRADSKANDSHNLEEDAAGEDNKISKKRKRLAYEENNSVDKVAVEESKRQKKDLKDLGGIKQLKEVNESLGIDTVKGGNGKVDISESQRTPMKQLNVQPNGNLEKIGEKSKVHKSVKDQKNSSEPRTVNAFQRVKVDEVKFADERLQDNSYWAKAGADSGYGAKAEEVLGQVRGRDFRHEKTKKKRGSYRGGQIDLQTHSIKFSYSDDD